MPDDDNVIDLFNAIGEQPEWEPPDGYHDAAVELGLPTFGSDDFNVWLNGSAPGREGKGRSAEWSWWMKCRQARSGKKGGRPPAPPAVTPEEVMERALEIAAGQVADEMVKAAKLLEPYKAAAVAVLASMLHSKDSSEKKFAVKTILEMTDGKPAQTVIEKQDGPRIIRYETVALHGILPAAFVPGAGIDSPGDRAALELPRGE